MTTRTPHLIIGAGPAGLAMAGRLRQAKLPFTLLEATDRVGFSWANHYDRVHLHTIKPYSALPHLPFPKDYPQYVPRKQFVEYLEQYARHFDVKPEFNQQVTSVRRQGNDWLVETASGASWQAGNVILCTGVNRKPVIPAWPGQEDFPGTIVHSKFYRNPTPYQGKTVLVVGMGNTGAEIALDLAEQGVKTLLSVRGPVNIVLRDTLGNPVQRTSMLLGKLPVWLGDPIGRFLSKATVGDLSRYGLQRRDMAPAKQLRTFGKTPVIDVGTIRMIRRGKIQVCQGIESINDAQGRFADGRQESVDAIILATGYTASLEDVVDGIGPILNQHGNPSGLWSAQLPGLYFLGFDPYSNGILHGIHQDSGKIAQHLQAASS